MSGCSISPATSQGSGGTVGSGGKVGTGGSSGTGGNSNGTGGALGSGGATGTGGALGTGSASATGGLIGRDAGRDLPVSPEVPGMDGAQGNKDVAGTGSEVGGTSDAACGTSNQPCCPYTNGKAGGTCDESSNCTSNPTGTVFTCAPCGASGALCSGSYGNFTCKSGMCNQAPPITCP